MNINKWTAEQCGVKPATDMLGKCFYIGDECYEYKWTIQDPRCREIVREHFRIITIPNFKDHPEGAFCHCECSTGGDYYGEGKTIAEAEINCIKAIKEAQSDD